MTCNKSTFFKEHDKSKLQIFQKTIETFYSNKKKKNKCFSCILKFNENKSFACISWRKQYPIFGKYWSTYRLCHEKTSRVHGYFIRLTTLYTYGYDLLLFSQTIIFVIQITMWLVAFIAVRWYFSGWTAYRIDLQTEKWMNLTDLDTFHTHPVAKKTG